MLLGRRFPSPRAGDRPVCFIRPRWKLICGTPFIWRDMWQLGQSSDGGKLRWSLLVTAWVSCRGSLIWHFFCSIMNVIREGRFWSSNCKGGYAFPCSCWHSWCSFLLLLLLLLLLPPKAKSFIYQRLWCRWTKQFFMSSTRHAVDGYNVFLSMNH